MAESWKDDIIKNKLGGKTEWTDLERQELSFHLDKDLEESLKGLKKKPNANVKDDWTEENWKEVIFYCFEMTGRVTLIFNTYFHLRYLSSRVSIDLIKN